MNAGVENISRIMNINESKDIDIDQSGHVNADNNDYTINIGDSGIVFDM